MPGTSRKFIIGDTREGYAVKKSGLKKAPWESQVWLDGSIRRRDLFDTRSEAVLYCFARYGHNRTRGLKIHEKKY